MNPDEYKTAYEGKDKYLLYFSQAPLKCWKYQDFERHFQTLPNPSSKKTLISSYKLCLEKIKSNKKTPPWVKEKIKMLLNDVSDQDFNKEAKVTLQWSFFSSPQILPLLVPQQPTISTKVPLQ